MYSEGFKSLYYAQTDLAGPNIESKTKETLPVIVFSRRAVLDTNYSSLPLFPGTPSVLLHHTWQCQPPTSVYMRGTAITLQNLVNKTRLKACLYLDLSDGFSCLYVFCILFQIMLNLNR